MNIEEAKKEFNKYTQKYLEVEDKNNNSYKRLQRKYIHSYRVMELAERIAKSLNLKEEQLELIKIGGLIHDIGRFEQETKYTTFVDHKSMDHGDYGAEILKKDNYINKYTTKNQQEIIKMVKYHNKYRVPKTLSSNNRLNIDIIRDADKIDILYALSIEELSYRNDNKKVSEEIMNQAKKKELVSSKKTQSNIDWIVVDLAFIFDLKFKKSYEIIKENDYHNKIIDIYGKKIQHKEVPNQLEKIRDLINNYIEEMVKC